MQQKTIGNEFSMKGTCIYSGNKIMVTLEPAPINTGKVFVTPHGKIRASLENAVASKRSIELEEKGARIINVEHPLATLGTHGIDNAYIHVERIASDNHNPLSQSIAYKTHEFFERIMESKIEVYPSFVGEERQLCDILAKEQYKPVEQDAECKIFKLFEPFKTEKLSFYPTPSKGLTMRATTKYHPIGSQTKEVCITPEIYKNELSEARRYVEHMKVMSKFMSIKRAEKIASSIAIFVYPYLGIGHGFNYDNLFLPTDTKKQWLNQEQTEAEVAGHTIVDRLGAMELLGVRFSGIMCDIRFSNHANDIKILRALDRKYKITGSATSTAYSYD